MSEVVKTEDALSVRAQLDIAEGKTKVPAEEQSFYAARVRVYPRKVRGTFRRLKWTALGVLLTIYYVVPWIRWDRGPNAPDQAVLIDLANRRGYFFWIEIWPQEVYYLVGLLVLAAVGLFLVTSLAGRVWCGYACPQTVWTDLFMWVERRIEGDRAKRIRLDRGPLTAGKVIRKAAKHGAWLVIALLTGGAWIMYFYDAPTFVADVIAGEVGTTALFFVGLFTATTYLLAGWAREQVCTYMCPWPRFQAAMFDEDTLIVTYEKWRGEPRGKMTKDPDWSARGDCVDCNACVAVCPTGIDIRDGQQLECISCALCVDACNEIMARVGRPANLIGYDTIRNQTSRAKGGPARYRVLRPRTLLYAMLFAGVGIGMLTTLALRSDLDINVLHDRTPLFVRLSDGRIRNGYTVKILNMRREDRSFTLLTRGVVQPELKVIGIAEAPGANAILTAKPDKVATYQVFVSVPARAVRGARMPLSFVLIDSATGQTVVRDSFFSGPRR